MVVGRREWRTWDNRTRQVDRKVGGSEHCEWSISYESIVAKF